MISLADKYTLNKEILVNLNDKIFQINSFYYGFM